MDHRHSEQAYADAEKAASEDVLLFDPATIKGDQDEMLEAFFRTSAPSKVKRSEGIGKIKIVSPSYDVKLKEKGNKTELKAAWEKLQKSGEAINFEVIKKLAISNSYKGGSWLIFFKTGAEVDDGWEKIARATVKGELGTHAKVASYQDVDEGKELNYGTDHMVSVSIKDFTDKENVMKVEGALRGLGFEKRIVFKPMVYSILGVYGGNKWGLQPSIYTSYWDDERRAGKIQDRTGPRVTYTVNYQGSRK